MPEMTNVLIVGVGGQGTILASDIFCEAALAAGFDVKKSEIHGMSQRGGSVFSHVRFGKKVHSPVIPQGGADILIALEEMETLRWLPFLNQQTKLVIATTRILPSNCETYPEGSLDYLRANWPECLVVDPATVLDGPAAQKSLNVALAGAASRHLSFSDGDWRGAIEKLVPDGTAEANWKAFQAGQSCV
jgi:indolepyruvate ferredoxin oxidoreductase beta subunit